MEYEYVRVDANDVNAMLQRYVVQGWVVHTFNRNPGATVIDILFERNVQGGYQ